MIDLSAEVIEITENKVFTPRKIVLRDNEFGSLSEAMIKYPDFFKIYNTKSYEALSKKELCCGGNLANYYETIKFIICITKILGLDKKELKILDIGTNFGFFVSFLNDFGYDNATGFDFENGFITVGKELGIKNIFRYDLNNILELKQEFDIVSCIEVFHSDEPDCDNSLQIQDFLNKINKILKEKGIFILKCVSIKNKEKIFETLQKNNHRILFFKKINSGLIISQRN